MRQERWPHAMIERIEMLRDAADAVDTRIRLVPDALGAIDVSVKTEGDTVRVHFNAEQAATRTLLADAQPRLAELAEARGLKLSQGSLGDSGAQQQRAPATPQTPNRPAPVSTVIADTPDDIRIA
jgi:flagellar hook-length control protein FliK